MLLLLCKRNNNSAAFSCRRLRVINQPDFKAIWSSQYPAPIGNLSKLQTLAQLYRRLVLDSRDGGVQTIRGADAARVPTLGGCTPQLGVAWWTAPVPCLALPGRMHTDQKGGGGEATPKGPCSLRLDPSSILVSPLSWPSTPVRFARLAYRD